MTEQRTTFHAAAYLYLVRDGKILLLRRYNTGWSDGMYSMVAGHLEAGEGLTKALCREALEEAGIVIEPENVRFVQAMHRIGNRETLDYFFTADSWQGEPYNAEPEKCDDLSWFALDDLPENILPYIRQIIERVTSGTGYYCEYGWDQT